MKTKLVLWGTKAENERVLIALELIPRENLVKSYFFPEAVASEEFSQRMLDDWRDGRPVEFPEGFHSTEQELSLTQSLLPTDIKPERDDIISRAQTEWHFVVLSSKLYDTYVSELAEIKDRIEKAARFDSGIWDELKGFWDKVQTQVRDKNLFRDHGEALRNHTNELFSSLKTMRHKLDEEFEQTSRENMERFQQVLNDIREKMENGSRLQSLFDDLKQLQDKFRNTKFTKEHRNKVWDALDAMFKAVKERRFGGSASAPAADDNSPSDRLKRRYEGLISAIEKMERSIQRDESDLQYHKRKVETTNGQLEAQLGQAKIIMIDERIRSKREKLNEMLDTKIELEKRMESQRAKDAKRAERDKLEEAKKAAEEKIASQIKEAAEARDSESGQPAAIEAVEQPASPVEEPYHAPAEEAAEQASPKENMLEAISETLEDSMEDVVDTVKAAAKVLGDTLQNALEEIRESIEDTLDQDAKPEGAESTVAEHPAPDQPTSAEAPEETAPLAPEEGSERGFDTEDEDSTK